MVQFFYILDTFIWLNIILISKLLERCLVTGVVLGSSGSVSFFTNFFNEAL